jgi:hypothetical protein
MTDDIQAKLRAQADGLMTLRRAIRLFPRPWIDGEVTFKDWLLACAVIQAAIARDEDA